VEVEDSCPRTNTQQSKLSLDFTEYQKAKRIRELHILSADIEKDFFSGRGINFDSDLLLLEEE